MLRSRGRESESVSESEILERSESDIFLRLRNLEFAKTNFFINQTTVYKSIHKNSCVEKPLL